MALSANSIVEIRNGGSDSLNGGLFNPGATLNSNGAATVANTSAPVFTSVTYSFVSADVGAWLFIKSGTNWTPGWYKIASVAAGAATLSAGIGSAILYSSTRLGPTGANTVVGCATVASPTSASWTVDYSQQDTVQNALTGLTTAAANAIILTASATVNMIGNGIVVKAGTNFITGYYQINAVSAGASITVDRNCTTAAGASGTAGIGGAFASPGMASSISVSNMNFFLNYNSTAYTATTASTSVTGGCVVVGQTVIWQGYNTSRYFYNSDANRPTFKIGAAVSTATLFSGASNGYNINSIIGDGNSQTTSIAFGAAIGGYYMCAALNCTAGGFVSAQSSAFFCSATGCSTVLAMSVVQAMYCEVYTNTFSGLSTNVAVGCLVYGNSGATSDGITLITSVGFVDRCTSYNNGRDGIRQPTANRATVISNTIVEGNAGWGVNVTVSSSLILINTGSYNNALGRFTSTATSTDVNAILGTSSFFTNAAGGVFTLNNTASAGALARAAGFPSLFTAGLTADYQDLGAAQHKDSGTGFFIQ